MFVCFKLTSAEISNSQEGELGALKPGQFIRDGSQRTKQNLERVYSEKESPVAQKLATPVEEEVNKGENLPVAEESEESLSSKVRILFRYSWLYFLMLGSAPAVCKTSK